MADKVRANFHTRIYRSGNKVKLLIVPKDSDRTDVLNVELVLGDDLHEQVTQAIAAFHEAGKPGAKK